MKYDNLIRRIIRETIEENIPMPDGTVVPYTNSIYDANHKRVNGSVNIDGRDVWISRSNNVVLFVYCKNEKGEWCLLASQRGGSGKWNAVAGFLDYYESLASAAARECFEETGVKIDPKKLKCVDTKSFVNKLNSHSQDIITTFVGVLNGVTKNYPTSMNNAEEGEVSAVGWIPLSEIGKYNWAFNHDKKALQWANVFLKNNIGKKDEDYNTIITTLASMVKSGKITQESYSQVVKAIELYLK
jgi:ADP-ribose pyrophosphatase YjhB (NUDIX family)